MCGSTKRDFPERSQALHKAAALSDAITSSPEVKESASKQYAVLHMSNEL